MTGSQSSPEPTNGETLESFSVQILIDFAFLWLLDLEVGYPSNAHFGPGHFPNKLFFVNSPVWKQSFDQGENIRLLEGKNWVGFGLNSTFFCYGIGSCCFSMVLLFLSHKIRRENWRLGQKEIKGDESGLITSGFVQSQHHLGWKKSLKFSTVRKN